MARPTVLSEPWLSLSKRLGGVAELGSEFGVNVSTIRRWDSGESKMSVSTIRFLHQLCDEFEIEKPSASIRVVENLP